MIERYTIKAAPAVSHKEMMKRLEEIKSSDTDALAKLQNLHVRIDLLCEPSDFKRISDVLKTLSKPSGDLS